MPYIITTLEAHNDPYAGTQYVVKPSGRTAVATLDDAREAVKREACRDHGWKPQDVRYHLACEDISTLPESGGTIGPLPDGAVIEVRHVDWMDFERIVVPEPVAATIPITTFDDDDYRDGLLRAFNARG